MTLEERLASAERRAKRNTSAQYHKRKAAKIIRETVDDLGLRFPSVKEAYEYARAEQALHDPSTRQWEFWDKVAKAI